MFEFLFFAAIVLGPGFGSVALINRTATAMWEARKARELPILLGIGITQLGAVIAMTCFLERFDFLPEDELRVNALVALLPSFLPALVHVVAVLALQRVPRWLVVDTIWTSALGVVLTILHGAHRFTWAL